MHTESSIWGIVFLVVITASSQANGACNWPTVFDGTWHDSQRGQVQFTTSSELSGFEVLIYGTTLNTYTCQAETFDTDGTLLIRSTTAAVGLGGNWYVYVCLKFTAIVEGVSYRYYLLNVQQDDAGQHRVKPDLLDSLTIADVCDESNGANGAEFVTIIKSGSEASSYITCPSVLLGRFEFNYTSSGGTDFCNDPANTEHMNVCTDKTQVAFDDLCAGKSIVYASGAVYCVASVTVGSDTFIQFYNNDASVDDSTTYRFSCMAISSDSLKATVVYNNCSKEQTSENLPRSYITNTAGDVIGIKVTFAPFVFCQGGCTWPSVFESSTWRDNTRGDITFGTDTLSGWSISVQGSTINQWECLDNSFFDSEGILIIKSTQTFGYLGGTWTTFICFEMTKITDNSYYYYQKHEQDSTVVHERGKFSEDGTITGKSTICSTSYTVPDAEFHFMVRSGSESASKQYCPPSLLAKMDYTHIDSGGTTTCDTSADNWDVCTDRTTMSFNYTSPSCSTQMAFSATGVVYCMVNLTSTYEYVVVYNTDASPMYKFACIVSNSGGTAASVVYKNCTINQTPNSYAKDADGTDIGYLATMTATETCPFLGPSTAAPTESASPASSASSEESGGGSSIIPMIIGAVVGILAILVVVAIIVYCLKCRKKSGVNHNDSEKKKLSDEARNGHVVSIRVEDVDSNPALTVHPERNTLTPLPPKPDTSVTSQPVLPPISNHA